MFLFSLVLLQETLDNVSFKKRKAANQVFNQEPAFDPNPGQQKESFASTVITNQITIPAIPTG
jgi:hypothetical protein